MIFDNIFKRRKDKQQSAWMTYREVLERHQNPLPGDEAKMEEVIELLGLTPEQIDTDAKTLTEYASLKPVADLSPQRHKDSKAARKAVLDFREETQRIVVERAKRDAELDRVERIANRDASASVAAGEQAKKLILQNPHLFTPEKQATTSPVA